MLLPHQGRKSRAELAEENVKTLNRAAEQVVREQEEREKDLTAALQQRVELSCPAFPANMLVTRLAVSLPWSQLLWPNLSVVAYCMDRSFDM